MDATVTLVIVFSTCRSVKLQVVLNYIIITSNNNSGNASNNIITTVNDLIFLECFIFIRREDSHFNEAKRSKWEMNRLNYILLKII